MKGFLQIHDPLKPKGQVVGINSAIDARAQGIGFAIPIDEIKTVIPILEKSGSIKKGFIGLDLADLDQQTVMYLRLERDNRGSLAASVLPNGPAEKAGLKMYDVIIEIDGQKVADTQDLVNRIADLSVGAKVKVRYLRNNRGQAIEKNTTVTIEERPSAKELLKRSTRRQDR